MKRITCLALVLSVVSTSTLAQEAAPTLLRKLPYNNPGLVVDLGVGLWAQPLPMDWDGDGDYDLLAATADKPSNGIYFFENPSGDAKFPVFKPGVWLSEAQHNITVSYVDGQPRVLRTDKLFPAFKESLLEAPEQILYAPTFSIEGARAQQWKLADYNGDGATDLVIGVGRWDDYGWDNAYNDKGEWTNGPLHGYVYVVLNWGSNENPDYSETVQVMAAGEPVDVYGAPSPNLVDGDGDGDLDLICGEFLDRITYFQNTGTRTEPKYAAGRFLQFEGETIHMDLEMLQVIALDWDKDGDVDLVVGQEDGRVALMEHTGEIEAGLPQYLPPRFFEQEAQHVKIGALCTPFGVDWDNDGDEDIIAGDTAGYLNFVENLGSDGELPKWAEPVYLKAGGETIRIQAGGNGSIQGPAEAKWGYTVCSVADWNHDGLLDIVINNIWGKVLWYENVGTAQAPELKAAQNIEVAWEGSTPKPAWFWWTPDKGALVTQWRTTPFVHDLNGDGLNDLIMLDPEGFLSFYERRRVDGKLRLLPPQRIFMNDAGEPWQMNEGVGGKSGRRKFVLTDWDGDGKLDLMKDGLNVEFWRNVAEEPGAYRFHNEGNVDSHRLAGHTTCPAIVDWNKDGVPDLVIGAEDGHLYYLENPRKAEQ